MNDRLVGETDRTVPGASMTPRVFCKGCGYALVGLASCKCPECGRGFDLGDRRTFAQRPPRGWVWRWGRRVAGVVLLLLLAAGVGLFWLWWGWHAEQPTIAQLRGTGKEFTVRSIGSERLRSVLGKRLEDLTDRVDSVRMVRLGAAETNQLDFRTLTHIQKLILVECELSNSNLSHLAGLRKLKVLGLNSVRIEKPDLAFLETLPALSALQLKGKWVANSGVDHIRGLKHLQYLDLRETGINDDDLQKLRSLSSLDHLLISENPISEAGLEHLIALKSLRLLVIDETLLDSAGVAKLKQAIPGLEVSGPNRRRW